MLVVRIRALEMIDIIRNIPPRTSLLHSLQVSNPNYFSCYTVTPRKSITKQLTTAAFVLAMGRGEPDYNDLEQGFVQNMLGQNHGVRITLHEGSTMPLIEQVR